MTSTRSRGSSAFRSTRRASPAGSATSRTPTGTGCASRRAARRSRFYQSCRGGFRCPSSGVSVPHILQRRVRRPWERPAPSRAATTAPRRCSRARVRNECVCEVSCVDQLLRPRVQPLIPAPAKAENASKRIRDKALGALALFALSGALLVDLLAPLEHLSELTRALLQLGVFLRRRLPARRHRLPP